MEKRQFNRVECELDSSFKNLNPENQRSVSETTVRDISEGGIRFRVNHFIAVHDKLLFKINLPNQKSVEAVAQPAWIREIPHLNQYDIGAKFISLSEADRDIIRRFASEL